MADVPEHLVAGRVEHAVQGDGELAGAEVGAEVAADLADRVDDVAAHLLGDLLQLRVVEAVQVGGTVDSVEQQLAVCRLACFGAVVCLAHSSRVKM